MEHGIGGFVVQETPLASLALAHPPDPELIAALQGAYLIDRHRTVEQDSAFGIQQIVDMVLRALSPGINDATTAVLCVDYLTAILSRLVSRPIPSSRRYEEGTLRLIAIAPTFASLLAASFSQIRDSAQGNVAILGRMLAALQTIGSLSDDPGRRRTLREEAQRIAEVAARTITTAHNRLQIESQLARAQESLSAPVLRSDTA